MRRRSSCIPAPYFRKHGKKPGIVAFVDGVTAAAIGTIAGAVVVLGKRSITDFATLAILAVTLFLLWKVKKLPEPVVVLLAQAANTRCALRIRAAGRARFRSGQARPEQRAVGLHHAVVAEIADAVAIGVGRLFIGLTTFLSFQ